MVANVAWLDLNGAHMTWVLGLMCQQMVVTCGSCRVLGVGWHMFGTWTRVCDLGRVKRRSKVVSSK
jgi:hypothetical protein